MDLDSSVEAAAKVMHGLFGWAAGRELIEISAKGSKWRSTQLEAEKLWDPVTLKEIAGWSGRGREIYMGAVGLTSRPTASWRRGNAAIRGHAGALWLDVDCAAPGRDGSDYFDTVEAAVEAVDAALGPVLRGAALVVGSGWGVQYWIPLEEPVSGAVASRVVRALVGWVAETTGKKIDRVWDVTRVMRMPGTLNWRAGPDEDGARPTGVLRWPGRVSGARLGVERVVELLARQVEPDGELLDLAGLLGRYGGVATGEPEGGAARGSGAGGTGGGLLDIESMTEEVGVTWDDVLVPWGWTRLTPEGSRMREVLWSRPGKAGVAGEATGERSAVVYADKPELLVVYSDSPGTGFAAGLRGAGARGDGAGVGVISKWRAWVDLEWGGDAREALQAVQDRAEELGRADGAAGAGGSGERDVGERLAVAWMAEMSWVQDWAADRVAETEERATGMLGPGQI